MAQKPDGHRAAIKIRSWSPTHQERFSEAQAIGGYEGRRRGRIGPTPITNIISWACDEPYYEKMTKTYEGGVTHVRLVATDYGLMQISSWGRSVK